MDLKLPGQQQCSALRTNDMLQLCSTQRSLLATQEDMDTKVLQALNESVSNLFEHIHVTIPVQARAKRAWLPFLGDIMKTVTGTMPQADMDRQNQIIIISRRPLQVP